MHPKEVLTKFLKSIGADTRSAVVGYIVVVLIVAGGGLSAVYKTSREWVLQILTTPTPLWATISLALLVYLSSRISIHKQHTLSLHSSASNTLSANNSSGPRYTIALFEVGAYKWKTKIYRLDYFEVDKYPICIKHDLPLVWDDKMYKCPEVDKRQCYNQISAFKHDKVYDVAKSYIEKEIRNNPKLVPMSASRRGILSAGVIE